jgi:hypothetical protein
VQQEVVGLESKPELNGKKGDVFNYQAKDGQYKVLLAQPALALSLQRGNCLLEQGTCVVLMLYGVPYVSNMKKDTASKGVHQLGM